MNTFNQNQEKSNTTSNKSKETAFARPFKTAIIGGLRGGNGNGNGLSLGGGVGGGKEFEDGADDIFN